MGANLSCEAGGDAIAIGRVVVGMDRKLRSVGPVHAEKRPIQAPQEVILAASTAMVS